MNLSGAPDKKVPFDRRDKVVIDGNVGRCRECHRTLGNIEGRDLVGGELVLTNGTTFRCRSCRAKNRWEPRY